MTNTTYIANGYQQDNGDNGKWWKLLLFVACIILICIIFHGCNPEKKIIDDHEEDILNISIKMDFIEGGRHNNDIHQRCRHSECEIKKGCRIWSVKNGEMFVAIDI